MRFFENAEKLTGMTFNPVVRNAIVAYAFEHLKLSRLICLIDRGNQSSINVAQRIGMTFEKEIVDDKGPALVYSRTQ